MILSNQTIILRSEKEKPIGAQKLDDPYRRQILQIQNTDSRTEGWILLSDEVRTPLMWKRRILKEFLMELCDFDSNFCSGSFLP